MPTMNEALLDRVEDWLHHQTRENLTGDDPICELNMNVWREVHPCGTQACVAGYVAEITGAEWVEDSKAAVYADEKDLKYWGPGGEGGERIFGSMNGRSVVHCSQRAQRELGFTDQEAEILFYAHNDVDDVLNRITEIRGHRKVIEERAARIAELP